MQNDSIPPNLNVSSASSNVSSNDTSFLDYRACTRLSEKQSHLANYSVCDKSYGTAKDDSSIFDDLAISSSIVKWTSLNNIYPILGAYGGPTCIYPTKSCYILGTSKGLIAIFSARQLLLNMLVPQITGEPSANHLRSPVENIVISADGTHLAASYQSGDCFLWNLNANTAEDNSWDADGGSGRISPLRAILHINDHKGYKVNSIGFLGSRHTALIVGDSSGGVFYHNGFRTRLWSLTYSSEQILNISSGESLLLSQTQPNIEGKASLYMVAVLTTSRFAVISTSPRLTTVFVEDLKPPTAVGSSLNGCLSWYKDASKVALALNEEVTVFKIEKTSTLSVSRVAYSLVEPALLLQWLTDELLGILTISSQFFVIDLSKDVKVVANFDLLVHDLLMPPNNHFAINDKKLVLLANSGLRIGRFATWSDIVLNHVQTGDYIGALKFIKYLLSEYVPLWPLIRLTKDIGKRERELIKPFYNLALAALRFIINHQNADYDHVYALFSMFFSTLVSFHDKALKLDHTTSFLERSMNFFPQGKIWTFNEAVRNLILEGSLTELPAVVFKPMLTYYAAEKRLAVVEDMVVMLDPETLDIDLAVKLCQKYELFGVLIYIWNKVFDDYVLPLADAVLRINDKRKETFIFKSQNIEVVNCIFDYLSFILTGRQYPQSVPIAPLKKQLEAKIHLYHMLFSGTCVQWPPKSGKKLHTRADTEHEPAFPYFKLLMSFNTMRMLSMLNEIFEDSLLNEGFTESDQGKGHRIQITRQYMIDVILDMMKERTSCPSKSLMAIFVACNIAKYPQFIRLSSRALDSVISAICEVSDPSFTGDSQRALECLLSLHTPAHPEKFIAALKEKHFKRVLFVLYIKIRNYVDLLPLALESSDTNSEYGKDFLTIVSFVLHETKPDLLEHKLIFNLIHDNFDTFVKKLGPRNAASIFETFDPEIHRFIDLIPDGMLQQKYLEELYSFGTLESLQSQHLKNLYFEQTCKFKDKNSLLHWLDKLSFRNLNVEHATNLLLSDNNYESAAIIHRRLEANSLVVDDMIFCITDWFKRKDQCYGLLSKHLDTAIEAVSHTEGERQTNWTKLIACFMKLYGKYKNDPIAKQSCNKAFQELFVRLAISEAPEKEGKQGELWNILTNALEHQEVIMMKAQDLRTLLSDVFTAYEIEWHIYEIILNIIQESSVELGKLYESTLNEGWPIINDECEVCGKKLWGLGLSTCNFIIWEKKRLYAIKASSESSSADSGIVSFGCRHLFHRKCLENLGQNGGKYFCLTCNTQ